MFEIIVNITNDFLFYRINRINNTEYGVVCDNNISNGNLGPIVLYSII